MPASVCDFTTPEGAGRWIELTEDRDFLRLPENQALFKLIRTVVGRGRSVLDLGCAHGRFTNLVSGSYTGIDVSGELITKARARQASGRVRFIHGDMETQVSQLDTHSFDVVLMVLSLHYLLMNIDTNPSRISDVCYFIQTQVLRVLKPSGTLLFVGDGTDEDGNPIPLDKNLGYILTCFLGGGKVQRMKGRYEYVQYKMPTAS